MTQNVEPSRHISWGRLCGVCFGGTEGFRNTLRLREGQFPQLFLLSASLGKWIQPQAVCGTSHKARAVTSRQILCMFQKGNALL